MGKICYQCKGTGVKKCNFCNGRGQRIIQNMANVPTYAATSLKYGSCCICNGTGIEKCYVCGGKGVIE